LHEGDVVLEESGGVEVVWLLRGEYWGLRVHEGGHGGRESKVKVILWMWQ
jgi:hypothetical protein